MPCATLWSEPSPSLAAARTANSSPSTHRGLVPHPLRLTSLPLPLQDLRVCEQGLLCVTHCLLPQTAQDGATQADTPSTRLSPLGCPIQGLRHTDLPLGRL